MPNTILGLVIVVAIVYAALSIKIVGPNKIGVRVSLGKPGTRVGPGLAFVPWIYQRLQTIPNLRKEINPPADHYQDSNGGLWLVDLLLSARPAEDPRILMFGVVGAAQQLKDFASGAVRKEVLKRTPEELQRADVQDQLERDVEKVLLVQAEKLGLQVAQFGITNFIAVGKNREGLELVLLAERQGDAARITARAEADVTEMERRAQGPDWIDKTMIDGLMDVAKHGNTIVVHTHTGGGKAPTQQPEDPAIGIMAEILSRLPGRATLTDQTKGKSFE